MLGCTNVFPIQYFDLFLEVMNARHPTAVVLVDHNFLENFLQHTLVISCLNMAYHLWLFLLITIACNYVIILAKSKDFLYYRIFFCQKKTIWVGLTNTG
jgi:hypothetical protein